MTVESLNNSFEITLAIYPLRFREGGSKSRESTAKVISKVLRWQASGLPAEEHWQSCVVFKPLDYAFDDGQSPSSRP